MTTTSAPSSTLPHLALHKYRELPTPFPLPRTRLEHTTSTIHPPPPPHYLQNAPKSPPTYPHNHYPHHLAPTILPTISRNPLALPTGLPRPAALRVPPLHHLSKPLVPPNSPNPLYQILFQLPSSTLLFHSPRFKAFSSTTPFPLHSLSPETQSSAKQTPIAPPLPTIS